MENNNKELEQRLKDIENKLAKLELEVDLLRKFNLYNRQRELDFMLKNPPELCILSRRNE